jgi:hypothetical protein
LFVAPIKPISSYADFSSAEEIKAKAGIMLNRSANVCAPKINKTKLQNINDKLNDVKRALN